MNDDKKIIDLDLSDSKYKKSLTLKELQVLNEKPEADLTSQEKKVRDKANLEFKSTIDNFVSGFNIPHIINNQIDLPVPVIVPRPTLAEQKKQTDALIELLEQNKEKDADTHKAIQPRFDISGPTLYFANQPIKIDLSTDAGKLCKKLFRSGHPISHPIDKITASIALRADEMTSEKRRKKIYSAKDSLNQIIASKTTISDLVVIVDKKIWFNQKYL